MTEPHPWHLPPTPDVPPEIKDIIEEPLLAQLLVQRGFDTLERAMTFLNHNIYQPAPPSDLPDMDKAVTRLNKAIAEGEYICVWGDFDVDGQTSTALLVEMLQDLGGNVRYYVPDRLTESHGVKPAALHRQLDEGIQLLLTCDTGIDAHEAVRIANNAGVDVIITDHHDLAETLPPAHAVINPKRLPEGHPLRELPGVGAAYKLAQAMYQAHERGDEGDKLLDLVALGIVVDVAEQKNDTRYLLQRGLEQLHQTERLGLLTLIERVNLSREDLSETHLGFRLGPRLNALGRLGNANFGVELLTTDDPTRAEIIVQQLEAHNHKRKLLVDKVTMQALSQIEESPMLAQKNCLVLAAEAWHPGVIGIAASRLTERYGKPTVLIALRPNVGIAHGSGSARSVEGCDIHAAIKTQAHLLENFGGHPMAAGLRIKQENIAEFRSGLSAALGDCHKETPPLTIDAQVTLPDITPDLFETLLRLAPFGQGNPSITLMTPTLTITQQDVFAERHKRLIVEDEAGHSQEVIWWQGAMERSPRGTFALAFNLDFDHYLKTGNVRLLWLAAHAPETPVEALDIAFIDWRQHDDLAAEVASLPTKLVWAEGIKTELPAISRQRLAANKRLVVWSAPPDQETFQAAVAAVEPKEIYVVGHPPPTDEFATFAQQLIGMIKHALIHKDGELYLADLAAPLGHNATTIRLGLDWLVAQGKLTYSADDNGLYFLEPATTTPNADAPQLETQLKANLAETAAYRRFFRAASLDALEKMLRLAE